MRWSLTIVLALVITSEAFAQSGRPAPAVRPAPPPRPSVAPSHPVAPVHRPAHPPSQSGQSPRRPLASSSKELVVLAATCAGLLGSPQGDGPVVAAATYVAVSTDSAERHVPVAPALAQETPLPQQPAAGNPASSPILFSFLAFIVIAVFVAIVRAGVAATRQAGRVRIIAVPPGEAPDHVRRAWVGLELPLVYGQADTKPSYGVISKQRSGPDAGYAVNGAAAVAILAAKSPEAAAWWREHAPHVLARGFELVFPADACERLG